MYDAPSLRSVPRNEAAEVVRVFPWKFPGHEERGSLFRVFLSDKLFVAELSMHSEQQTFNRAYSGMSEALKSMGRQPIWPR